MDGPSAYHDGHALARRIDPEMADRYLRHTLIGDPQADAAWKAMKGHPAAKQNEWIRLAIEEGPAAIPDAPQALRDLIAEAEIVPPWFDSKATLPACRAFHRDSGMIIVAFVGAVLIEGFATLVSKSFSITGRLVDQGLRRLKQNNRHLVEVFLPGGLDRHGEGWKLSVRIRLMHAKVRSLLAVSPEWDTEAWGTPLSSAHLAAAVAGFSARLMHRAEQVGVTMSQEEQQSFMLVWRYTGRLMGLHPDWDPELETMQKALHMIRIGAMCEPPPSMEAIIVANGLINSAPIVSNVTEPAKRRAMARRIYGISRELIGDELADQLKYPPAGRFGALAVLRWTNRAERLLNRVFPALGRRHRMGQFQQMMALSYYADGGLSYRMPAHVHAERDRSD
ncbi:oxygenase MpaB family protein [Falsiroseomonas selenitidurans]|uniref:DUF2236 domain-containing protein n=1 Tax=Falsiroseomonas selenitidurans TaxID=2716335 RepID=A0ABX1DZV3_9PROT|nr:oxygenase MpaB family protein [Falsiroseomonas selenitidurans]NKC30406.1 DUF2236 domain-containing protein [Falsiroseomonas selenitidurans]